MTKVEGLRKKYPTFFYQGYSYNIEKEDLKISFDFVVPASPAGGLPDMQFHPTVIIKNVSLRDMNRVGGAALNNLIFHLGLMEIPSYWKATCSPEIIVEAGYLNKQQIAWWKDLILKGMGEYFYKNKIDFTQPNFLTIKSTELKLNELKFVNLISLSSKERTLVPVGGGKDAVVTMELLKRGKQDIVPFLLNPKKEQEEILKVAGLKNPVVAIRTIDPRLLELNRKGYLNGHTPFSAYLAFLSMLCATLFNTKYIALSNERSSNEGNVRYLGEIINHQYSKSFDFEKRFRSYVKTYLAKDIEYFSFLRPLYELQIARMFAKYPKYFPVFLSCNEAHKTYSGRKPAGLPAEALAKAGQWCGKCAKCLFVWLILRPFVKEKQLFAIFKKNLLQDKTLKPIIEELTGSKRFKPFECVGTIKESKAAFSLRIGPILSSWNPKHFLPPRFSRILSRATIGGK